MVATRKKMNAGDLKEESVEMFKRLQEMGERYKNVNQWF